jgi:hypothetical protein
MTRKNKNQIWKWLKRKDGPYSISDSLENLAIDTYEVCEELKLYKG